MHAAQIKNINQFAIGRQDPKNNPAFRAGDTISAELTGRDNSTASLRAADGFIFNAPSSSVEGSVGDILRFKVVSGGKSLTLKQIMQKTSVEAHSRGDATPADEIKESTRTVERIKDDDLERIESAREEKEKEAEATARIKRAMKYMENNAGKSAAAAIVESGLSLTKISFNTLYRLMREAERRPENKLTAADIMREASMKNFSDRANASGVLKSLNRFGLPYTEKNIAALEGVWEKLPERLDDGSVKRLVEDENEITIERIYKSRHGEPPSEEPAAESRQPALPERLEAEISKFFINNRITDAREYREAARLLIKQGLPLDGGNVGLAALLRRLGDYISKESVFEKAAEAIARDGNISDIKLAEILNDGGRRTLAETQLKLTAEAAARLSETNLQISTGPQRETLNTLKRFDDEAFSRFLRFAGAEDELESVSQIKTVYEKLSEIKPLTANIHAGIINREIPFTINAVHESVLYARAQEGYGKYATVPDARFGDTFASVKPQFAPLLEGMDVAPTNENMKAAFILSRNSMDVNFENLERVKEIDLKINAITRTLHPMIAANMIKEGLSPLEMHADEMLAYIKQFGRAYGEDPGEKLSKYILELDEKNELDSETRNKVIAIYRMLYVIQKDGAASLGLAAKQNEPLTLGSLMELAKYFEKRKRGENAYERAVDDAFGALERLKRPEASIRELLERQEPIRRPAHYHDLVADNFIGVAEPDRIAQLLNKIENGERLPLEDLAQEEPQSPRQDSAALIARFSEIYAASPKLVAFIQGKGVAATPASVRFAEKLAKNPRALSDALEALDEETRDEIEEIIPDIELRPLREGIPAGRLYAEIYSRLDDARGRTRDAARLTAIESARELTAAAYALSGENEINIPVKLNGGITNLNLYVLNERALRGDEAKAFLSLGTRTLRNVGAYYSVSGDSIEVVLRTEDARAFEKLSEISGRFRGSLEAAGFGEIKINFEIAVNKNGGLPINNTTDNFTPALSEFEYLI